MITTRDLDEPKREAPKRLNIITTSIIKQAAPRPEPKGDGLANMITTHDEPKVETKKGKKAAK